MSSLGASNSFSALLAVAMAGCTPQAITGWDYRNGPNVEMPYETRVKPTLANQRAIMLAFRESVREGGAVGSRIWYYTTIQGFNFVDTECAKYLDELYALDHGRERFKSAAESTGLLVNAILNAEPVSKVTMSIVAQAFGLVSKFSDTFANSYLFSKHSSTVHTVVEKMQSTYRDEVMSNPDAITSEPEAYMSIRRYLELCLPPTIEAKIEEKLAGVEAKPAESSGGADNSGKKASASGKQFMFVNPAAAIQRNRAQAIAPTITLD